MSMKVGGLNGRRQMPSGADPRFFQIFCIFFVTIKGFFDSCSPLCLQGKLFGACPGSRRRARDQVVTLQDVVVELLAPQVQSAFHGEKVWLHSRNLPVAEIVAWLESWKFRSQHFEITFPAMPYPSLSFCLDHCCLLDC